MRNEITWYYIMKIIFSIVFAKRTIPKSVPTQSGPWVSPRPVDANAILHGQGQLHQDLDFENSWPKQHFLKKRWEIRIVEQRHVLTPPRM